jgi:hypothetical protein
VNLAKPLGLKAAVNLTVNLAKPLGFLLKEVASLIFLS